MGSEEGRRDLDSQGLMAGVGVDAHGELSLSQGGGAEGRSRLSTEPWGLQHLEVGGEGTSAEQSSWVVLVPRKWQ